MLRDVVWLFIRTVYIYRFRILKVCLGITMHVVFIYTYTRASARHFLPRTCVPASFSRLSALYITCINRIREACASRHQHSLTHTHAHLQTLARPSRVTHHAKLCSSGYLHTYFFHVRNSPPRVESSLAEPVRICARSPRRHVRFENYPHGTRRARSTWPAS